MTPPVLVSLSQKTLYEISGPAPAQPASWTRWTTDIAPPAPAANPTHGSPEPSLKFDGVDYVHSGSAGLPSGESTAFVIGGIEVNVNDLAVVGTTFEGRTGGLNPNPPKDTDGRREESGRGGEGATGEIAWVPFGVGRSADGLHRRTGAPMAVCGSCDARDGERIRSRELSRTGLARVCGDLRLSGGWVADGAVRPGVEWLAAGPRRG